VLLGVALLAALPLARARAENWALLIGIDRYQDGDNINALGGADGDALALAKALTEVANFPGDGQHVRVLTSGGDAKFLPLKNRILRELETLRQRVKPGDTVFVSFSGHGVESGGVPYLLPYDADISTGDLIRDTGIAEEKFRDYLRSVPAAAVIVAFDMCRVNADRSGRSGGGDARLTAGQVRGLNFARPAGGSADSPGAAGATHPGIVATFFACAAEQRSYEWREKGRGYFSYYLEQGLRGKAADASGAVSLDGLKRYLSSAVPDAVRREELGKAQTPTGRIEGSLDAGGVVLARGAKGKGGGKAAPAPVPEPVTEVANASVMDTKARLTITTNVSGATVMVNDAPVADGEYAVDLGLSREKTVEVGIAADGYVASVQTVKLLRGKTVTLPVVLAALPPKPVAPVAAAVVDSVSSGRTPRGRRPRRRRRRVPGRTHSYCPCLRKVAWRLFRHHTRNRFAGGSRSYSFFGLRFRR